MSITDKGVCSPRFNINFSYSSDSKRTKQQNKRHKDWKGIPKTSTNTDDMNVYIEK